MEDVERCAVELILGLVGAEVERAQAKYHGLNSAHEARGVIEDELEEWWQAIRAKDAKASTEEMIQVAATAVQWLVQYASIVRSMVAPEAVPEPQTAAEAAIADAALWPEPLRTPQPPTTEVRAQVTPLGPATPRVVEPGEA